jgi:hypothetical protein
MNLRSGQLSLSFFSLITMSTPTQLDIFEKVWKDFIKDKPDLDNGITIPRPSGPPKVSLSALPGGPHLDGPILTWSPERLLSTFRLPDPRINNDILIDLVVDDNMEQLEKIWQHEYASAELVEYWKVREEKVKGQWEEWKHVAAKASDDFAAAKEDGEEVAVAMQYAILDRAQGRIIHWAKAVAKEEDNVQQQEVKLRELARPAMEAIVLLGQRFEINVGWPVLAYSTIREDAKVSVSGRTSWHLLGGDQADHRLLRRAPTMSEEW